MNIAIIGAGFTGLSSAYKLLRDGHTVSLLEQDGLPGGLAVGFKLAHWSWSIEKHYHHWFTNDSHILNLASHIGQQVITTRPKTSVYIGDSIYQLDSPAHVLTFPKLSPFNRLRMASVLEFIRLDPYWKPLEKLKTHQFLSKTMGQKAYGMVWEPQMANKFGIYKNDISLAWFWARIHKRTSSLSYPEGGFLHFSQQLVSEIKKLGGECHFNTTVLKVISENKVTVSLKSSNGKEQDKVFDKLIVTTPASIFTKIAPQLSQTYKNSLVALKGLGAVNLILRLKKPLLRDGTYWLSVCNINSPIMAIVEHTNFMDKKHYGGEHIVYLGNYVPHDHVFFSYSESELLEVFDTVLSSINPSYRSTIVGMHAFKAPFAQPIIPTGYSKFVPSMDTPLHNVYLANMQQVYPWDRGTNYAVELGERVASHISL